MTKPRSCQGFIDNSLQKGYVDPLTLNSRPAGRPAGAQNKMEDDTKHIMISGKWINENKTLVWETACGLFIEDGSEDEKKMVPHHLRNFIVEVNCDLCQRWVGFMELRALDN